MRDWQPIETAPTDGTSVLIWDSWRKGMGVAEWAAQKWRWSGPAECDEHSGNGPIEPTHWMPLPAIPSSKHAEALTVGTYTFTGPLK